MRDLGGIVRIVRPTVWCRGPDFAAARVVNIETLARLRLNPFATDEILVLEEVRIVCLPVGQYLGISDFLACLHGNRYALLDCKAASFTFKGVFSPSGSPSYNYSWAFVP